MALPAERFLPQADVDAGAVPAPEGEDPPREDAGAEPAPSVGASAEQVSPAACGHYAEPLRSTFPESEGSFLTFTHDGLTREYKVYVPSSYRNDTPSPVVYILHGLSGNAESVGLKGTKLHEAAEKHGFVLVLPNGYGASWNAGDCCDAAADEDVDDVDFLREVQARLSSDLGLCIDHSRVYGTGYSNGAFMMYRLACEASDLFAALVSVGGTLAMDKAQCEASLARPMPFLEIHGKIDVIARLEGPNGRGTLPSIEWIAYLSGCEPETVATEVPETSKGAGCVTYPACAEGAEVTFCLAERGGHCWFGSETCGTGRPIAALYGINTRGIETNEAAWSFLSRFRCEECGR